MIAKLAPQHQIFFKEGAGERGIATIPSEDAARIESHGDTVRITEFARDLQKAAANDPRPYGHP